jgi:hypothetical protein
MTIQAGQPILAADAFKIVLPDINILNSIPPLSGLQSAAFSIVESSGAGTVKPVIPILSFDASTDEGRMWVFRMPLVTSGSLYVHHKGYMAGANTSKTVCISVQIAALSATDVSATAKVFAGANIKTTTVPNAAGTMWEDSVTLTNADSIAVGDWVCMAVFRDVSEDDAAGDYNMTEISLQQQA